MSQSNVVEIASRAGIDLLTEVYRERAGWPGSVRLVGQHGGSKNASRPSFLLARLSWALAQE